MSIKVPKQTVEYQSHNHCQCDFCSSRRATNAKKLAVSQRAAELQHAKDQNGCCCQCHDALNASTFAASRNAPTSFDPEYPAPVNQTALNASRGRVGAANNGSGKGRSGAMTGSGTTQKSKDDEDRDAAAELDRLERLLILEHKARVEATLEADRLGTLRNSATVTSRGPQPLPDGYMSLTNERADSLMMGSTDYRQSQQGFGGSYNEANGDTIRDAYALAHECPVTPPAQCGASHRLQDTMNGLRAVTMDPVNPAGRARLQQVLYSNGVGEAPVIAQQQQQQSSLRCSTVDGANMEFGSSLAKNRTSHPHPQGAGLVWVNGKKQSPSGTMNNAATVSSLPNGATAAASQKQADGSATTTKKVTYAI